MFDHLTDEQRSRIHTNHLRRKHLDEALALAEAAEPGQWLVEEAGETFRIVRRTSHGPHPELSTRASFELAAASESLVPRLLRGIDALERGVATAQADAASMRRCYSEEQARHEATIERQSKGATGPEHELELLAQYVTLSAAGDVGITGTMPKEHETRHLGQYTRHLLTRWAGGASIADELSAETMARVRRQVDERAKHRAEELAELEDLRARLRDAIEKVARGEVPEALKPGQGSAPGRRPRRRTVRRE